MFSNHQERSHKQRLAETPCTEQYARCCGRTAVSHRLLPDFIEDTADHIGAFLFLGLIQMGIDICRGGQVGVPEEGRYIQQRHILIDEDAGDGVSNSWNSIFNFNCTIS